MKGWLVYQAEEEGKKMVLRDEEEKDIQVFICTYEYVYKYVCVYVCV